MRYVMISVVAVALLSMFGCGGGGNGYTDLPQYGTGTISSSDPQLDDGSRYDRRVITSPVSGDLVVVMASAGSDPLYDPYLIISRGSVDRPTVDNVIAVDDDAGSVYNAVAVFRADRGSRYTIFFNSYGAGDYGQYSYSIGTPAQLRSAAAVEDEPEVEKEPKVF